MNCASSRVRKIRHTRSTIVFCGMNWWLFAIDKLRGAAYLAKRSSWPFASVVKARESASEDCFFYTAPQWAARTIVESSLGSIL
jgi:hypothetical protein